MENESLIAALRKAEAGKYAAVPSEEAVEYEFSDRFRKRMDRLVRAQRQPCWHMVRTPARRSLFLLLVLLTTFGVRPDRNPLFRFEQTLPQMNVAVPAVSETGAPTRPPRDAEPTSAVSASAYTARPGAVPPEEPSRAEPPAVPSEPSALPSVPSVSPAKSAPAAAVAHKPSGTPDVPSAASAASAVSGPAYAAPAEEPAAPEAETASAETVYDGEPASGTVPSDAPETAVRYVKMALLPSATATAETSGPVDLPQPERREEAYGAGSVALPESATEYDEFEQKARDDLHAWIERTAASTMEDMSKIAQEAQVREAADPQSPSSPVPEMPTVVLAPGRFIE